MLKRHMPMDIIDCDIDISATPNLREARLIYVDGKGALSVHRHMVEPVFDDTRFLSQISLNGVPLIEVNSSECPTCRAILTSGHGIENSKCQELERIREKINHPFVSLEKSIEDLVPVLTLLQSGLYIIADGLCYPTDGNQNFFWDAPVQEENPASSIVLLYEENYELIEGHPVYLYPTQSSSCYNRERVDYYKKILRDESEAPRAIAYYFSGFLSFLIDGHHKACAASLMKREVNTLIIFPCVGRYREGEEEFYSFASMNVSLSDVPQKYRFFEKTFCQNKNTCSSSSKEFKRRTWEDEYRRGVSQYPSLYEYAYFMSRKFPSDEQERRRAIKHCLDSPTEKNLKVLMRILFVMKYRSYSGWKELAMHCIKHFPNTDLEFLAYKLLLGVKDDEVERLFLDYLIECEDRKDRIYRIVNSYWE